MIQTGRQRQYATPGSLYMRETCAAQAWVSHCCFKLKERATETLRAAPESLSVLRRRFRLPFPRCRAVLECRNGSHDFKSAFPLSNGSLTQSDLRITGRVASDWRWPSARLHGVLLLGYEKRCMTGSVIQIPFVYPVAADRLQIMPTGMEPPSDNRLRHVMPLSMTRNFTRATAISGDGNRRWNNLIQYPMACHWGMTRAKMRPLNVISKMKLRPCITYSCIVASISLPTRISAVRGAVGFMQATMGSAFRNHKSFTSCDKYSLAKEVFPALWVRQ